MDPYLRALIKTHIRVDSGQRVWYKEEQLPTFMSGSERKVVLPNSKIAYTFNDLKRAGAQVDVVTLKSLARQGGEGRWRDNIEARRELGLPSNVYIANARTIEYATSKGRPVPALRYVGRSANRITEVFDTIDEVVKAMDNDQWRTEFSRGSKKVRK